MAKYKNFGLGWQIGIFVALVVSVCAIVFLVTGVPEWLSPAVGVLPDVTP